MLDLDIDVNNLSCSANQNLIGSPIKCKLIMQIKKHGKIESQSIKVISNLSFSKNCIVESVGELYYCNKVKTIIYYCDKKWMTMYLSSIVREEILQEISYHNTKIQELLDELEIFKNVLP